MAPAIKRPAPRAAKLDALVNILSASKAPVTAAALAKSLKVSERTVYRYVSELVGQGMQIQGGAGFGYVFWPAVDAWSITLTGKEAQAVLFGLKVAEMRSSGSFAETVRLTSNKIQDAVPVHLFLSPAASSTQLDPGVPPRIDLEPYLTAIHSGRRMVVDAGIGAGHSACVICPIALNVSSMGTDLLAWIDNRKAFELLPVSDVTRAELVETPSYFDRGRLLRAWERSRSSTN